MQESGLIIETGQGESSGGRKPRYIAFNGASRKFYAFDWTSRTACLMDLGGSVLAERTVSFPSSLTPTSFADQVKQVLEELSTEKGCPEEELLGFGLSLPGLIRPRDGTVVYSVELGWQNVCVSDLFADIFADHVFLERTGNVMALGEYAFGVAQNTDHFQLFILGDDGIGVSAVIHGDCQHGANCMYGELGHIKLPSDIICSCGQRGCLEAVVSNLLLHSGGQLTEEILEYLALGVSTAINIVDTSVAVMVDTFANPMTVEQQSFLMEAIQKKITGQHQRRLDIHYTRDIKKISLQGISANVFERYYAIG